MSVAPLHPACCVPWRGQDNISASLEYALKCLENRQLFLQRGDPMLSRTYMFVGRLLMLEGSPPPHTHAHCNTG